MKRLANFLLILGVAACGPDKGDSTTGDTDTGADTSSTTGDTDPTETGDTDPTEAGDTDPTEATGTGDEGTTGPVDPGEYGEMEACEIEQICETFLHPMAEGSPYHSDMTDTLLEVEKCILGGLRDGAPGRYVTGIDSQFTNGENQTTYLIHVHADRKVTVAKHSVGSSFLTKMFRGSSNIYSPAQTCTLADTTFFATCLTDKDNYDHFADCFNVEAWWTGCAEMGPRCE